VSPNVLIKEKDIWYSFVIDVLLTWKQVFKTINCVTLRFGNTEMYSGIYVANYYRIYFCINVLCQRGLVKSPHSHGAT